MGRYWSIRVTWPRARWSNATLSCVAHRNFKMSWAFPAVIDTGCQDVAYTLMGMLGPCMTCSQYGGACQNNIRWEVKKKNVTKKIVHAHDTITTCDMNTPQPTNDSSDDVVSPASCRREKYQNKNIVRHAVGEGGEKFLRLGLPPAPVKRLTRSGNFGWCNKYKCRKRYLYWQFSSKRSQDTQRKEKIKIATNR